MHKPSTKPIIREHKIPTPDSRPYIVVEGPDGNLWFCESRAAKIGCFDPDTGAFREFPLSDRDSMPVGIARRRRRQSLVHRENKRNRIGRITVDGDDHRVRAADGESLARRHRARA